MRNWNIPAVDCGMFFVQDCDLSVHIFFYNRRPSNVVAVIDSINCSIYRAISQINQVQQNQIQSIKHSTSQPTLLHSIITTSRLRVTGGQNFKKKSYNRTHCAPRPRKGTFGPRIFVFFRVRTKIHIVHTFLRLMATILISDANAVMDCTSSKSTLGTLSFREKSSVKTVYRFRSQTIE